MSSVTNASAGVFATIPRKIYQFLQFVNFCHVNLSKFLSDRETNILFVQLIFWSSVAYCSLAYCEFIDQFPRLILKYSNHLLFVVPLTAAIATAVFGKHIIITLSETIVNLFGNHDHIYTCLICLVEATIVWAITVLKSKIADENSMALVVLMVAVYYTMVTVFELTRLKDRGLVSGVGTVILFVAWKRFGVWSVPFTAAVIYGKHLISSECCRFCRERKNRGGERREHDQPEHDNDDISTDQPEHDNDDISTRFVSAASTRNLRRAAQNLFNSAKIKGRSNEQSPA